MISVDHVVQSIPHFDTFCSMAKVNALVDRLRKDPRFEVAVAGTSVRGQPIHDVRFGKGRVKALFVAWPHAMEPIGGLTVFSLMTLLEEGHPELAGADVEWHFVPCIDPDGALLNEAWSQKPVTLESYMKGYYLQPNADQVDTSFPINYKRLVSNKPSHEAAVLKGVIDRVRPDFYFDLHNCHVGGAFFFFNRDVGAAYYQQIYELLDRQGFPLQRRPIWSGSAGFKEFSQGILSMWTIRNYYDHLEPTTAEPEKQLWYGASSLDYLSGLKPEALTFVAEMGYLRHPMDESDRDTGRSFRQFKLRLDADTKYLATVLREEWEKVKGDVNTASPFYRSATYHALPTPEKLVESAWPVSRYPVRDALFNPEYARSMTEGEVFSAAIVDGGFCFLRWSYQLVRLLKDSPQTPAIQGAIARLDRAFEEALAELGRQVDFDRFRPVPCDTLARVQLGSGLIALNSLLA